MHVRCLEFFFFCDFGKMSFFTLYCPDLTGLAKVERLSSAKEFAGLNPGTGPTGPILGILK